MIGDGLRGGLGGGRHKAEVYNENDQLDREFWYSHCLVLN